MKKDMQIFLSYVREDEEKVAVICKRLAKAHYKPWMDKNSLVGGEDWEPVINKTIGESYLFLACLSAEAIRSTGQFHIEMKLGLRTEMKMPPGYRYLIPVRLEECEIPEVYNRPHWVDLFEENGWERLMIAIKEAVKNNEAVREGKAPRPRPSPFVGPGKLPKFWTRFDRWAARQKYLPMLLLLVFLLLAIPLTFLIVRNIRGNQSNIIVPPIPAQNQKPLPPRPLPNDPLVVAITDFSVPGALVSDALVTQASLFPVHLREKLNKEKLNKKAKGESIHIRAFGCPHEVKPDAKDITFWTKPDYARSIGNNQCNAHLVVWGKSYRNCPVMMRRLILT